MNTELLIEKINELEPEDLIDVEYLDGLIRKWMAGYTIVPVEPSDEMIEKGEQWLNRSYDQDCRNVYKAMIEAAK